MKLPSLIFLVFLSLFYAPSITASISIEISNLEPVNDYYSLDAVISGAATDSSYFVQAVFKKENSSNYSGFTWSEKGEWLKYDGSPEKEYIKDNFPLLVSGQVRKLLVKPDPDKGNGNFTLRLRRYTGGSPSHTGDPSNELTLAVQNQIDEPTNTPTPTSTPSPTRSPTPTPTPTPTSTSTPIPAKTPTPTSTSSKTPTSTSTITNSDRPTITQGTDDETATHSTFIDPDILGETTTSSTPILTATPEIKGKSSGSGLNRIFIILGLSLAIPAAALYFFSDKVKIS